MTKPDWEAFGMSVMQGWPDGDVDGLELHDLAERFNVIVPVKGGYDPEAHFDRFEVEPERGDPWFEQNYSDQPEDDG